ncbi:MAG: GlsB/YeaQ/YmgE family stress response membrane protein [Thermoguttaceae bacterium]
MLTYLGLIIVWLIVGGLAGTVTGRLVTFKKEGLGRWTNLAIGLVGALIGGGLFKIFNIDLHLGKFDVSFEDLIAAFLGSLLFVVLWWIVGWFLGKKRQP